MAEEITILLLEDEPLILMDLEFAAQDRGCNVLAAATCAEALEHIAAGQVIHTAVLDVTLGGGETCFPVSSELGRLDIPFVLHSGDLDRHDETIRTIGAVLIAKPASAEKVIGAAIARSRGGASERPNVAAD